MPGLYDGTSGLWSGKSGMWDGIYGLGSTVAPVVLTGFDKAFNPSPFLVYSEEDHLVVRTNDNLRLAVRGLTGHTSGKWYVELLPIVARLRFGGVVDSSFSLTGGGGDAGTNRCGIQGSSLIAYPNVNDPIGQFAAPGTIASLTTQTWTSAGSSWAAARGMIRRWLTPLRVSVACLLVVWWVLASSVLPSGPSWERACEFAYRGM